MRSIIIFLALSAPMIGVARAAAGGRRLLEGAAPSSSAAAAATAAAAAQPMPAVAKPIAAAALKDYPMPAMQLPPVSAFLPPMDKVGLPPVEEFLAKAGLPSYDKLGLPPIDQLLQLNLTNGDNKTPSLRQIAAAVRKADAVMTGVVYELLPPDLRAAVKKGLDKGKTKANKLGLPNVAEAVSSLGLDTPEFNLTAAVKDFNVSEAILKFNATEAAAKLNVTLAPALKGFKLPPPPPGLPDKLDDLVRGLRPLVVAAPEVRKAAAGVGGAVSKLPPAPTLAQLMTALDSLEARRAFAAAQGHGRNG